MYNIAVDKSYNISAQYEIIGRVPSGTSVIGYMLRNRISGECSILTKEVVEQLALNKNIYNANAQLYGNVVNIKGINCKISQMPKYYANGTLMNANANKVVSPILKIVGKVQSSKSISAYILEYKTKDNNIMRKKVDKDTVITLAREGYIKNAKAQLNNGELMLRGIGEDLASIKVIKEE